MQLTKEIKEAEQLLDCILEVGERDKAERRLRCLRLRLSQSRGERIDFGIERRYRDKLLDKL